jgi:hypothetical protein
MQYCLVATLNSWDTYSEELRGSQFHPAPNDDWVLSEDLTPSYFSSSLSHQRMLVALSHTNVS